MGRQVDKGDRGRGGEGEELDMLQARRKRVAGSGTVQMLQAGCTPQDPPPWSSHPREQPPSRLLSLHPAHALPPLPPTGVQAVQ